MATHKCYRTKDGRADYGFSFERQASGNWRAYITSPPSYGGRDKDRRKTHRNRSMDGRDYVCWNRPLRTLQDAENVAALWADVTQEYIKTGYTIDQQMQSRR